MVNIRISFPAVTQINMTHVHGVHPCSETGSYAGFFFFKGGVENVFQGVKKIKRIKIYFYSFLLFHYLMSDPF